MKYALLAVRQLFADLLLLQDRGLVPIVKVVPLACSCLFESAVVSA